MICQGVDNSCIYSLDDIRAMVPVPAAKLTEQCIRAGVAMLFASGARIGILGKGPAPENPLVDDAVLDLLAAKLSEKLKGRLT